MVGQNSYFHARGDKKGNGPERLPFGGWNPYYSKSTTYQDKLVIANETTTARPTWRSFTHGRVQLLSNEFIAEWLDIELTSPDARDTVSRNIFDKLGYQYRRADDSCYSTSR